MNKHILSLFKLITIAVVIPTTIIGFILLIAWLLNVGGLDVLTPTSLLVASTWGLLSYSKSGEMSGVESQDRVNFIGAGLLLGIIMACLIAAIFLFLFIKILASEEAWVFVLFAIAFSGFGLSGWQRYRKLGCDDFLIGLNQTTVLVRPNVESVLLSASLLLVLVTMGLMGTQ